MLLSELLQAQATTAISPDEAPRGLYLRVVRTALAVVAKRDGERESLENQRARTVLREAGACDDHDAATGVQGVLARLDVMLATHSRELLPSASFRKLSDGIANVFGYSRAEQALFELALHATRCRKLQRALNLVGEVDDEEASQLFADALALDQEAVVDALRKPNPFRRMQAFELLHGHAPPFAFLKFSGAAAGVVRNKPTVEALLALFCRPSPPPKLGLADFGHQASDVAMLRRYMHHACAAARPAVNILLHGAPGTGKTQLVRALAASLDSALVEIPSVDEDRDPLSPWRRLTALTATQEMMRTRLASMVLFDEVEDVFPLEGGAFGAAGRGRTTGDRHKGWLTQMLEENSRPTFWVCNEIGHIDPAYIRRFDMVVELLPPGREVRGTLVEGLFAGVPLQPDALNGLKAQPALAPAHLERIAGVLKAMAPVNEAEAGEMLTTLERQTVKALALPRRAQHGTARMPYRSDCINTDVDLAVLTTALERQPSVRLCLFGAPGTGKTEWARHLASRLGRPLHVKRASDLLGKYVGESERLIRDAFDSAARDGAVLLIDEADSVLRDRATATQGWEVSMVNEVLTCMEDYEGIFVASTNLEAVLDKASARRFDFKIRFGYLRQEQVRILFAELLGALELEPTGARDVALGPFTALTPGDFANVLRQAKVLGAGRTPDGLLTMLGKEQAAKQTGLDRRRIGFV